MQLIDLSSEYPKTKVISVGDAGGHIMKLVFDAGYRVRHSTLSMGSSVANGYRERWFAQAAIDSPMLEGVDLAAAHGILRVNLGVN